jgi:carboxymethylenebutenolidase
MLLQEETVTIETPTGLMQTYLYRPVTEAKVPGIVLYSEIYQRTGPIKRIAAMLAGHGYIVAVPEIFHELEPAGRELAYDTEGTARGNEYKVSKPITAYDSDSEAAVAFLSTYPHCNGRLGTLGICIGGHLAFRAAFHPSIRAAACLYATDIHKGSLGKGGDDSLQRCGEIGGELLMIWGRQDPHIPKEGRALIYQTLSEKDRNFTWHEFNAMHAFLRDEGYRYDPELGLVCYRLLLDLFTRQLKTL